MRSLIIPTDRAFLSTFYKMTNIQLYCVIIVLCYKYSLAVNHVIRHTEYGKVKGVLEHVQHGKVIEKFLGIPYAQPPIGKLRFEAPIPPHGWGSEILRTENFGPACPQGAGGMEYIKLHHPGFDLSSEDCLYLNVYVPKIVNHNSRMPVLVFIHGGSYFNGMGGMFEGSFLAIEGIIVVTVNYRLGALGFLSTGDSNIPGNYGMLDQVAALKWVKQNIGHFDGDPDRITIDGHSAGGCSVGLLMISPLTKGLFRNVIIQSGSPLAHWAVRQRPSLPDVYYNIFTSAFDCLSNNTFTVKQCLQSVTADEIFRKTSGGHASSPRISPQFTPVVDGYFLPKHPRELLIEGDFYVDNVMTGATKDEGLVAANHLNYTLAADLHGLDQLLTLIHCIRGDLPRLPGIVDTVLEVYASWPFDTSDENVRQIFSEIIGDHFITAPTHDLAEALVKRNSTVYLYNFEYRSEFQRKEEGVVHGSEIFYLCGFPMTGHPTFLYGEKDRKTAKMLMHLWANFVKNGLPSLVPHKEFHMAPYSLHRKQYSNIFDGEMVPKVEVNANYKDKKIHFWNKKLPQLLSNTHRQTIDQSRTVTKSYFVQETNSWVLISICIVLAALSISFLVGYCRTRRQLIKVLKQNGVPLANRMI
ncbi:pyrethroid hydrolase Ces2e-like [Mytilus galloprovincialis]|uniref:pyrethroid hydrolase Ces2e-like n=1 Tax=Mytilus galloprovincialis TaxID=29158 RepID=UPI003F7CCDF2